MENFIKDPSPQDALKLIESLYAERDLCLSIPYTPDAILFSGVIMKYFKGDFFISFTENCETKLIQRGKDRWISHRGAEVYIGNSSFSSTLPLSKDDLTSILAGVYSSVMLERRRLTEWELGVVEMAKDFGVSLEKNLKIPSYNELPLFLSLMLSIDPYLQGLTGSRENSISLVKEIGLDETTKLGELDESHLNTLLYRIMMLVTKLNPKATRDDVISDKVFYMGYDLTEVAMAVSFFLDNVGSKALIQLALTPSVLEILVEKTRERLAKGFTVGQVYQKGKFYVVETSLPSPMLLSIVAQQVEGKPVKPVVIKLGNEYYSSKYFLESAEEGLIRVDIKD
ncbi:MAG: hypothetical protein ASUL_02104 [Candidatus Aramenus sulfurataquae]|jgi:single-stranded-DNA-specific exonuclease|uniref:Single-stranded DNA exonuclease n=2 Tax=Candidatus Aramenus sulfurataquae TaxID=1326980 RepID=W7KP10_9CREN|nr:MAG: hypothetical protein ASUL_02104 [Candidatus Aramenus sulfurataquae]MCL7344223.1 hypothetical protein [Candidatus Aramenus sulfurataquae]